jgi:hypothetical protein
LVSVIVFNAHDYRFNSIRSARTLKVRRESARAPDSFVATSSSPHPAFVCGLSWLFSVGTVFRLYLYHCTVTVPSHPCTPLHHFISRGGGGTPFHFLHTLFCELLLVELAVVLGHGASVQSVRHRKCIGRRRGYSSLCAAGMLGKCTEGQSA